MVEQFRNNQGIGLPVTVLMLTISPYCFDEPESFDECALWSMLIWVNQQANLSPEEYNDLTVNTQKLEDAVAFLLHLEASGFTNGEMESLMDRWFENYGAWDGLTEDEEGVICCNPPIVINNGITLADWTTPASPVTTSELTKVGFSVGVYPDNFDDPNDDPEDIRSGTNGDDRGIYLDIKPAVTSSSGNILVPARPYTDSELFDFMPPLFWATTHCDNRSIAFLFKEEFRNNTQRGKFFYHRPLSDKVAAHPVMKNYMKSFGKQLNERLSISNGQMTSQLINMGTERPAFNKNCSNQNTWYDRLHGYQILINDTQAVDIFLIPGSYTYTPSTKVWKGRFLFVVTDHFGFRQKRYC
ncbi:MAG: hypothetical protein KF852_09760 [Saprospiraceae bacterium]|nr:hypothetical protein [Saprospiraceae bacterium]